MSEEKTITEEQVHTNPMLAMFTFAFAEENFLRGNQLGLDDAEKLLTQEATEAVGTAD